MSKELTSTMKTCLEFVTANRGKICRAPGGFWKREEDAKDYWARPYFGTKTIEALVTRGRLVYTVWKTDSHGGKFPIEAALPEVSEVPDV